MIKIPGNTYAVIMAGGKGERFWPLSTSRHPKQVLSLTGGKPLVSLAVDRLKGLIPESRIFIITSLDLVGVIAKAVPSLPKNNIIGEPVGRDTAAVCALASSIVKARDPGGVFCILTADHIIKDIPGFQRTLRDCFDLAARNDVLITIGIKPAFPSTGFGYIDAGRKFPFAGKTRFLKAKRFVEKPDQKRAEKYVDAGNFYWNSGMFIWSVYSIQKALSMHRPELLEMAKRMEQVAGSRQFNRKLAMEYAKIGRISIDYAVMEKSGNIIMAKACFTWDDVGSWTALENIFPKDSSGNVLTGTCEAIDSSGNVVISPDRLTALIGVRDLVVVHAENATLICAKDKAQEVKKMVQLLAAKKKYQSII